MSTPQRGVFLRGVLNSLGLLLKSLLMDPHLEGQHFRTLQQLPEVSLTLFGHSNILWGLAPTMYEQSSYLGTMLQKKGMGNRSTRLPQGGLKGEK